MFLFLFILIGIIIYVQSFKEDFSKEKINTIAYGLWIVLAVFIIYGILSSITKSR